MSKVKAVMLIVAVFSIGEASAQTRAVANPCVEPGNRSPRLLPVDEASSRPEFLAYRRQLEVAVARRDLDAVAAALDPGIRLGFDASGGIEAFRKQFTERSELWEQLARVLALGGSFRTPTGFEAPYVFSRWPDRFDSFECAAITGRNVRVRGAAQLDGPILTTVSHAIVRVLDRGEMWSQVQLGDGRRGFVSGAYVRSPVDYRALFNLVDGRWRMTAFVAGD
jgi:hypothetical protein